MPLAIPWLDPAKFDFPDPASALIDPNGLLAVGGDLQPARLLKAYQLGIFPWYSEDQPPLWWTPNPRTVLFPNAIHISRSLAKLLKSKALSVTCDRVFKEVLKGCAAPRANGDGTWLIPEMQAAYLQLHQLGHAHSIEVWQAESLVGGLYGIALQGIFYGESMFSRVDNASKVALVSLCQALANNGYKLIDCQVASPHLSTMGASQMSRSEFMHYLPAQVEISRPSPWPYNSPVFFGARAP